MNDTPASLPRLLLVGVDYSPESARAAEYAIALARNVGARVHLFHAWVAPYADAHPPAVDMHPQPVTAAHPDLLALVRRAAEDNMAGFASALDTAGVAVTTQLESGDPKRLLLEHATTHDGTWLVLGKRTLSPVAEWFLGNVAAYVVRHCQVPVLVVPREPTP